MANGWKRRIQKSSLVVLALIAIASIVSYPRETGAANAELLRGAHIDSGLLATIKRSCADCHSDATHYPWYSYIAPVSWLIRHDVTEGREHLNLSRWSEYPILRRQRCLTEIANQVRDGEMPLPVYTLLHPDAKLSKTEADAIFDWTQAERSRLLSDSTNGNAGK